MRLPGCLWPLLFIEVDLLQKKRTIMKARGRCLVNGEVVSEAEMMFGIVDP